MNVNYQKELEKLIEKEQKEGRVPRLFLHSCCAPCSSYVMEYLSQYFSITVFYYNPNISPKEEYEKRVEEIRRLIGEMEFVHPVTFVEGKYEPERFYEMAKGLEKEPSDVLAVTVSAWRRLPVLLLRESTIILQPLFLSAP